MGNLSSSDPPCLGRENLMDKLVRAGVSRIVCSESKGKKGSADPSLSITQLYSTNSKCETVSYEQAFQEIKDGSSRTEI